MKTTVLLPKEIDIKFIKISVPVRYDEEDIPNDFPMRNGNKWEALVEIETGAIKDYPVGRGGDCFMKVCDEGTYILYSQDMKEIARIDDYVPHEVVPGEFGDYIDLKIGDNGIIKNWAVTGFDNFFRNK